MRRFEFIEGSSSKFWQIVQEEASFTIQYGRIGTSGKTLIKSFANSDKASAEAGKLIAEKLGKGYTEVDQERATEVTPVATKAKPKSIPVGPMSEAVFWDLIKLLNWKKTGDDDAVLRPVVKALSRMSVEDIFAFDDILAEKLYALDTREICRGTYRGEIDLDDGEQYVSADDFLYARCVIVANGQEFFEDALANPLEVPQDMEFEALLELASSAYEEKTDEEYEHVTPLSYESFSNHEKWEPTAKSKSGKFTSQAVPPGNKRP